jgi:hypothetical protein
MSLLKATGGVQQFWLLAIKCCHQVLPHTEQIALRLRLTINQTSGITQQVALPKTSGLPDQLRRHIKHPVALIHVRQYAVCNPHRQQGALSACSTERYYQPENTMWLRHMSYSGC